MFKRLQTSAKELMARNGKRLTVVGLFASGVSGVVRGVWMIYPPAAFIVGGCLLISLAIGFTVTPTK